MIPKSAFPDLSSILQNRATGIFLARQMAGDIDPTLNPQLRLLVITFARLSDGLLLDYTDARSAYYGYLESEEIGGTIPVSQALVPYFHYIENCISNIERTFEMGKAVRSSNLVSIASPLIDKAKWEVTKRYAKPVADIRNAIQHLHNDLKSGNQVQGAVDYSDAGQISLGSCSVSLKEIANAVKHLNLNANDAVAALPKKV